MTDQPAAVPIDMLLWCPGCGAQHVDAPNGDWTNPPHRSHLCHKCGIVWRPADVPTNGVAAIVTRGKGDTWSDQSEVAPAGRTEAREELARQIVATLRPGDGTERLGDLVNFILSRERAAAEKVRADALKEAALCCDIEAGIEDYPMTARIAASSCAIAIRALAQTVQGGVDG